jgi:phospholipase/lecithinase/hemolysin
MQIIACPFHRFSALAILRLETALAVAEIWRREMKKLLRSSLYLVCFCLATLTASAQKIDRIVFFGDSLSDAGNHFIYSNGQSARQPFSFDPPEASYDIGGHHFSNGNTWAEQLAISLHTPTSGSPSLRAPGNFTDYAVGRARARTGSPVLPQFDLTSQVNQFLADFHGQVPANSLIVIWIGGNDIDDGLYAYLGDSSGATSVGIVTAAADAVVKNVSALYSAGARMFLIVNIPDLAKTPYVKFLDTNVYPGIGGLATLLTTNYNAGLSQLVIGFPFLVTPDPVHPLQFIRLLDANALFDQMTTNSAAFGIVNPGDRCTQPFVVGNAICSTPNRYLFWDGIHPTTTAHSAIAGAAMQLLQ